MFKPLFISASILSLFSPLVFAETENTEKNLDVSGTIRFQYTHNDYLEDSGNKIDFSDAVLWLNYQKDKVSGHLDYRVYEAHDKLAGIHFPVNAWLAYNPTPEHKITAGLQPVPIGLSRYYSSTYNLTQLYQLGLEEVNNWGLSYQYQPENFNFNLAYFFAGAGSHTGKSKNSSHYSSNLTAEPSAENTTQLEEKNSIALKVDKTFQHQIGHQDIQSTLGSSYLYTELDNLKTHQTGERQVWTAFYKTKVDNLNFNIIYGGQDINNKDDLISKESTFGFFDGYYNVANKGNFLSTEVNYTLPYSFNNWSQPLLYSNYSRYFKDEKGYQDSERLINGVYTKYKDNLQFYLEYISTRNDTAFGVADGYSKGSSNEWNNKLFLSLGYYF
ncbi:hypothetical protein BS636_14045 [Acinetobacter sp. LoGeW2-3]|uniref:hypothetical protein n=1 Tax=Acinetobacter sp. LoGeW2-3 TaxID=1808001 RepID=UPI000C05C215|nr:hypothetical protein [Acinetobacter sp. LoGeW2-3]ATO20720.1 hypothetical protein BS636_14045 [Acinetobacter sp. LoGeW2-3]